MKWTAKKHEKYTVMREAMKAKKIRYSMVADKLKMCERSVYLKICGDSDFTVQEAIALSEMFGIPVEELFKEAPND